MFVVLSWICMPASMLSSSNSINGRLFVNIDRSESAILLLATQLCIPFAVASNPVESIFFENFFEFINLCNSAQKLIVNCVISISLNEGTRFGLSFFHL